MIRQSPRLMKLVTDKRGKEYLYDRDKRIYVPSTESIFQALSADADYNDGINPSAAVIDELHRHRNGDLLAVIDEGMATRDEPLLCIITTAGGSRMGVCWEWHEQARRIIEKTDDISSFHATIYAAPDDANVWDERVWIAANPALQTGIIDIEKFRASAQKAKGIPSAELNFRRLRLNQWVAGDRKWINMLHWKQCGGMLPVTEEALREEFEGRECYAGIDLGESDDFAAYAKLFPWLPDDPRGQGGYDLVVKLYLPEAALGKRPKSEAQFRRWANEGFIEVHEGDITNHDKIKQDVLDDQEYFEMKDLGYDPWRMKQMSGQLESEGMMVSICRQSPQTMSEPSKLFERLLAEKKINHGGHPVLTWMANNAVVRTDPSGNIRPDKAKSEDKMDGIVATVMALERATFTEDVPKKGGMTLYIPDEDADAEAS
jgi:phage terminase large subunit-like protein